MTIRDCRKNSVPKIWLGVELPVPRFAGAQLLDDGVSGSYFFTFEVWVATSWCSTSGRSQLYKCPLCGRAVVFGQRGLWAFHCWRVEAARHGTATDLWFRLEHWCSKSVPINRGKSGESSHLKLMRSMTSFWLRPALKRLAAAVRFRPWPPRFQRLTETLLRVLVPIDSNSSPLRVVSCALRQTSDHSPHFTNSR